MSPHSTAATVACECHHLSVFSANMLVSPNNLDSFHLSLFLGVFENPIVVVVVFVAWCVYALLMVWARRKDRADLMKVTAASVSQILLFVVRANFLYHSSLIIYYSLTHFVFSRELIFFHIYLLRMVDANFIFILVFFSPYSRSVWHPFGCFILPMDILFCVSFSLHHVLPTL